MNASRLVSALALAAALVVAPLAARAEPQDRQRRELARVLDALLAHERPGGGWTFAAPPGARPQPSTVPLKIAERVAAPLGLARWDVVVLRSPGTPAAGLALLGGFRLTARADYLAAARRAGDLLMAIQLPSGGWFSEMPVEGTALAPWYAAMMRRTALDDDVTTGAIRLLLALWHTTGERPYRTAAERALAFLLRAQLPQGAWPLVWRPAWKVAAWGTFEDLPTLNDGASTAAITTLLAAGRALERADFVAAGRRGGDWLLRARRPAPQAGWAQQYDLDGAPAPARRFEPAALASWESRYAIETLLDLAAATNDPRYCASAMEAARWLARSAIGPGCWARFYALGTNTPVYVASDGRPVDSPAAAHVGYDWTGDFGIPALLARLGRAARPAAAGVGAARPVAGDPGVCPGQRPQGFYRDAPDDPRALVARASLLLAALEPPAVSPCAPGVARGVAPAAATLGRGK